MRIVIFEGTMKEFEAVEPFVRSEERGVEGHVSDKTDRKDEGEGSQQEDDSIPTYEEALKLLHYKGGPSENQKKILRILFNRDGPVGSSTIRDEYGWSNAEFRGIRTNFARRENNALERDGVDWVKRNWISEEGENQYSLPSTVRQALSDEFGW